MVIIADRFAAKSTSNRLPDVIVCRHANRDRHHTTVVSQIGYNVVGIVLCSAHALAAPLFGDQSVFDLNSARVCRFDLISI